MTQAFFPLLSLSAHSISSLILTTADRRNIKEASVTFHFHYVPASWMVKLVFFVALFIIVCALKQDCFDGVEHIIQYCCFSRFQSISLPAAIKWKALTLESTPKWFYAATIVQVIVFHINISVTFWRPKKAILSFMFSPCSIYVNEIFS